MQQAIRFVTALAVTLCILLQMPAALASSIFRNLKSEQPESIEDHHVDGKWLVVMLWSSDCIICNKEAHEYVDFHLRHREQDAIVLGISIDGQDRIQDAQDFVRKHNVAFQNLLAEWDSFTEYYEQLTQSRWIGTPSFLIFGPDGELEAKQTGAVPPNIIEMFLQQHSSQSS
ncbi:MAG: TlpA disulfide reductase family protein [Gammaproteobacteria bacterium]